MKILLAMSGGVDSSVVAHLLRSQGHDVIGVRFTLWIDPLAPAIAQVLPSKCCTTQNIHRANTVAESLGIPLHILDLEQTFKRTVVDPYLEAYRAGLTPNPCIGCNRTIKFGILLDFMRKMGCERLATGHYARTEESTDGIRLLQATDERKDQSYYLYGLDQEQLQSVLFPLGNMQKSEVYALAERFAVPMPESYRESQDLCFFPEKRPQEFLKRHLEDAILPGPIKRRDGKSVGMHRGLPLYTLGQRRGLGVGGLKIPLEVVEKNVKDNALIVADRGSEQWHGVRLDEFQWCTPNHTLRCNGRFQYRTRSLSPKRWCSLVMSNDTKATIHFDSAESPQAPGQSLVLSIGDQVLGGGVIAGKIS